MIGIIVELIISWLLLYVISKKQLSILGFTPTISRLKNLGVGLLIATTCCILYQIMTIAFINNYWLLNKQVTFKYILENSRSTLVSVLYEELIFRGALLYIAIEKFGIKKACVISAVGFGIYHWFSFNVIGNPLMMLITFIMTGITGLTWAFAFAKTKSLYLPIALHFGWNFVNSVVFANGNFKQAIFVRANDNQLEGVLSLVVFLFQIFGLVIVTYLYLKWLSRINYTEKEQQPLG